MTSIQAPDEQFTTPVYNSHHSSYASKEGFESDGSSSDHEPDEHTSLLAASVAPRTGVLGNRSVSSLLDRYVQVGCELLFILSHSPCRCYYKHALQLLS